MFLKRKIRMAKTRKQRSKRSKKVLRQRGGEVSRSMTPIRRVVLPSLKIQTPILQNFQNNSSSPIEQLYTEQNKSKKVNIGTLKNPNMTTLTKNIITPKMMQSIVKTRKNRKE